MNSEREPVQLADAVERLAASVVGLPTRRLRSAGSWERSQPRRVPACAARRVQAS